MSLLEAIPEFQFTNQELDFINETMRDFKLILRGNLQTDINLLIQFLIRNINLINFQEPFLELLYSQKPTIFVDALNLWTIKDWDQLSGRFFAYAHSRGIPEIISQTFDNYLYVSRMDYPSIKDKIQFLKNLIVLLSENNKLDFKYVIVFKIHNNDDVREGIVKTKIPYIYLMFINDNGIVRSEVDDLAVVFFAYLIQRLQRSTTGILTSDNYSWADVIPDLRQFIDNRKVIFELEGSRMITNSDVNLQAPHGKRTQLFSTLM